MFKQLEVIVVLVLWLEDVINYKIYSMKIFFKISFFVILLIIIISAGAYSLYSSLSRPASIKDLPSSTFIIPKGQAIDTIGKRLEEEGLIKNSIVFKIKVKLENWEKEIQAGTHLVSPSMDLDQILFTFSNGTNDVWITIPEGWRREEIAASLARTEEGLIEFDSQEFLTLTNNLEGKLFPDSYLVPKTMSTSEIVELLTSTFDKKVVVGLKDEVEEISLSLDEVVTLASIIEREGRGYEQMREISGILHNRLENDIALQVDATLQYVKGYSETFDSWWITPYAVDKELDSPYNTYQHQGLPPNPICNPGLDAIKAALLPVITNDFFYIHDSSGVLHTAQDLNGHNANVNKYLR
jgi:UPF0755 protein